MVWVAEEEVVVEMEEEVQEVAMMMEREHCPPRAIRKS